MKSNNTSSLFSVSLCIHRLDLMFMTSFAMSVVTVKQTIAMLRSLTPIRVLTIDFIIDALHSCVREVTHDDVDFEVMEQAGTRGTVAASHERSYVP
jgi:hypothetical protein